MKYLTLEEANTYFSTRINAEPWDSSDEVKKEKYLNHVEKVMDRLSFSGLQETAGMIFPRIFDVDAVTPQNFKDAICEEALQLLNNRDPQKDLSDLHVKSSSVAGFNSTVNELLDRPWIHYGLSSPTAWQLISPYLLSQRSFSVVSG